QREERELRTVVIVFVLVAVLVLAVLVTANWYLWRRLFRDTTRGPGAVRRTGAVVIAGGWAVTVGAFVAGRAGAPFWLQQTLAWPGFLWLACVLYLVLATVAGEPLRPLLRWILARRAKSAAPTTAPDDAPGDGPDEPARPIPAGATTAAPGSRAATAGATGTPAAPDGPAGSGPGDAAAPGASGGSSAAPATGPSRRLFVSRVVAGAAAAAAVGTVGYGTYGVLRGPRVERVTVPLAKLPRAAHGYRIAVVSDIHLRPVLGRGFAQKVVDTINSTQPDLIAVVGDLVDGNVKDLAPATAPLAQLRTRHGSSFVTGNHEYTTSTEQGVEGVRRLGRHPLENARTELPHFALAGVNDLAGENDGQGPDYARALGDRDRGRACVLLAHQPVQIHEAV